MRTAHPSREARHLAIARLYQAWLWRHGQPSGVLPEDVAIFEIMRELADKTYDIDELVEEARVLNGRQRGLDE